MNDEVASVVSQGPTTQQIEDAVQSEDINDSSSPSGNHVETEGAILDVHNVAVNLFKDLKSDGQEVPKDEPAVIEGAILDVHNTAVNLFKDLGDGGVDGPVSQDDSPSTESHAVNVETHPTPKDAKNPGDDDEHARFHAEIINLVTEQENLFKELKNDKSVDVETHPTPKDAENPGDDDEHARIHAEIINLVTVQENLFKELKNEKTEGVKAGHDATSNKDHDEIVHEAIVRHSSNGLLRDGAFIPVTSLDDEPRTPTAQPETSKSQMTAADAHSTHVEHKDPKNESAAVATPYSGIPAMEAPMNPRPPVPTSLPLVIDMHSKNQDPNDDAIVPKPKSFFGCRHTFALMAFLGLSAVYMMRINLSVAIVTMINPNITENTNSTRASPPSFFAGNGTLDDGTCPYEEDPSDTDYNYEFDWGPTEKGNVLGAFFWGYTITQIPGGILAERYGGKWVFFIGVLFTDIFCLLSPIAARLGGSGALIAVRMLTGLAEGLTFPTATSMVSKWVPNLERTTIGAFVMAGTQFGTVISLPLSGWLCDFTEVDNGWPLTFYVPGAVGVLWLVAWVFLVYDTPSDHPRISEDEKRYIIASTGKKTARSFTDTPWLTILTSIHLWAILIAHFGHSWGYSMLLTELPSYMGKVLHFDIKSNGLLSALPYLAMWLFSMVFSVTADALRSRGTWSTTTTRKVFTTIGLLLPAAGLVGATYTGCDKVGTIALLTLAAGFNAAVYSGFLVNHIDIASNYAGSMMGITNCVASTCGFIVPAVAGAIVTDEEVLSQWQTMFFIAAGVYGVTNLFYVIFGTGVEQPWNKLEDDVERRSSDLPNLKSD